MKRTSSVSRSAAVHYYTRTNASNHEPRGSNCTPGVQEALGRLLMGQDCSLLPKGCARQPRGATAIPGDPRCARKRAMAEGSIQVPAEHGEGAGWCPVHMGGPTAVHLPEQLPEVLLLQIMIR